MIGAMAQSARLISGLRKNLLALNSGIEAVSSSLEALAAGFHLAAYIAQLDGLHPAPNRARCAASPGAGVRATAGRPASAAGCG